MTRRRFDWVLDPQLARPATDWDVELERSAHFSVLPSLGSLVPGWILIVPRRPLVNLAGLRAGERAELQALTHRIRARLAGASTTVFDFEHGSQGAGSLMGCGVDQAHLHLVPLSFDLICSARVAGGDNIEWAHIERGINPWAGVPAGAEYVLIRAADGRGILGRVKTPVSQWVRKVIARQLERDRDWDYNAHAGVENIAATKAMLSTS